MNSSRGTRKDVCAVGIGVAPKRSVDSASETVVVGGGHDATGTDVQPLDAKALRAAVARSERSSFAVSARFGARNPEHEVLASNIILELRPEVTVVSGSDLAGVLRMEERLFLAAKNAELVHVIRGSSRRSGRSPTCPRL